MPTNIVEGIFSQTGLILDLGTISVDSGVPGDSYTVGKALQDLATQNASNPDYIPEYISFQTASASTTNLSAMGTIPDLGSVWRIRLTPDGGSFNGQTSATVGLDSYNDGTSPFSHVIVDGYEMYVISEVIGTHIYSYPSPTDPENAVLTITKAVGTQDALTSTPNTISSEDNYIAYGSRFRDEITGTDNRDRLIGRNGNDTLVGGLGRDFLSGGSKNDVLRGEGGKDSLRGGIDSDQMFGGGGADNFIYSYSEFVDVQMMAGTATPSIDSIEDFSSVQEDKIELRSFSDPQEGINYVPAVFDFASRFSAAIYDVVFRNGSETAELFTRVDTTGTNADFAKVANVNTTLTFSDFVLV